MKTLSRIILASIVLIWLYLFASSLTSCSEDEYSEGMHWYYSIHCENGFVYKTLNNRGGTIQVLNSDGTPLHCGSKIY